MAITNTNQAKKVSTNGTNNSSSSLSSNATNSSSAPTLATTSQLPSLNSSSGLSNLNATTAQSSSGTTERKKYSGYDGNYGYVDYARDSGMDISSVNDIYEQKQTPSYGYMDYARDMGYDTSSVDGSTSNSSYQNAMNMQFGSNANNNSYGVGQGSSYAPNSGSKTSYANASSLGANSTQNNQNGLTYGGYIERYMTNDQNRDEVMSQYHNSYTPEQSQGGMTFGEYINKYMNNENTTATTANSSTSGQVLTPEQQKIQNNMNSQGIMTYDQFVQSLNSQNNTTSNIANTANISTATNASANTGTSSTGLTTTASGAGLTNTGNTVTTATNGANTGTTASLMSNSTSGFAATPKFADADITTDTSGQTYTVVPATSDTSATATTVASNTDTSDETATTASGDGTATDETTDETTDSTSATGTTYSDSQASLKTQYDETVRDAYNSYLKSLSDYGANAEKLNSMGLSNSGYSDYLNSQAYRQYRQDVADANNTYQSGLLSLEQSANESYQTFLDNITNGTTYTDSQIETYAKTYGWTDEQISSLKSSINENTYKTLQDTVTTELNSDGISDSTISEIQTSDLTDEQKQSLIYQTTSESVTNFSNSSYSANDYQNIYDQILEYNSQGLLSDEQCDELLAKLVSVKEKYSVLSNYGADTSTGMSATAVAEKSFGDYSGTGDTSSKQSKYVNAIIQAAIDGKIANGTIIDFNYGAGWSYNTGSVYVYYNGYWYETNLNRTGSSSTNIFKSASSFTEKEGYYNYTNISELGISY